MARQKERTTRGGEGAGLCGCACSLGPEVGSRLVWRREYAYIYYGGPLCCARSDCLDALLILFRLVVFRDGLEQVVLLLRKGSVLRDGGGILGGHEISQVLGGQGLQGLTRVSLFYQGLTRAEHKGWWSFCDDRVFALFAPRTVFYSVGQKPSVAPSSTQLR